MIDIYRHGDDIDDNEEDLDLYVNNDSPDIEHINVFNDDSQEEERCIKMTVLDFNGDPVHAIFNEESLDYLLDSLHYCKKSLQESFTSENDEEWLENA